MSKNKTTFTQESVTDFIQNLEKEQQRLDSEQLIALMKEVTQETPQMWGPSIIGFGSYDYTYASGHQGNAPLLGFSPRKAAISLYVFTGLEEHAHALDGLGTFKKGKACLYVKKLSDVHLPQLVILMKTTMTYLEETYTRL